MCAIIDANVAHEVFGSKHTEAGQKFLEWINSGSGRLVVGDKLLEELNRTSAREWARQALIAGLIRNENSSKVNYRTAQLQKEGSCRSNDLHVIALAQVSGARLLYTTDGDLQKDFKNRRLLDNPQGSIYPARGDGRFRDGSFRDTHKKLLKRRDLCRTER